MNLGDDRGTITVDVEVSEALVDLIRQETDTHVDVGEWIAGAAELRLQYGWMDDRSTLSVDVPDEIAESAELLAEHSRVQHGRERVPEDALHDFVALEYRFQGAADEQGGEDAR